MLNGKNILLGISGGIAAYKSVVLIRLFQKKGANVKVVVTKNALQFITSLTLRTISRYPVYENVFDEVNSYSTEHISITDWADLMVVAPATANIIGKFASGIADDALSTSFLSFNKNKKVFIAPAMNTRMYEHPVVQQNIEKLKKLNVEFIEPASGMLACNTEGKGRMEEPENIVKYIEDFFSKNSSFAGKRVLITAGPTVEAIDPVRFISNHSSGKMGYALANEFKRRGASVKLVSGPVSLPCPLGVELFPVMTADEMLSQCLKLFKETDIAIMAAAVADYKPAKASNEKIKSNKSKAITLQLIPNPDIAFQLGKLKKKNQLLIGFALETTDEKKNALKKLKEKNFDAIILNSLRDKGAGFATDTNKITLITTEKIIDFPLKKKTEVATDIADFIQDLSSSKP